MSSRDKNRQQMGSDQSRQNKGQEMAVEVVSEGNKHGLENVASVLEVMAKLGPLLGPARNEIAMVGLNSSKEKQL